MSSTKSPSPTEEKTLQAILDVLDGRQFFFSFFFFFLSFVFANSASIPQSSRLRLTDCLKCRSASSAHFPLLLQFFLDNDRFYFFFLTTLFSPPECLFHVAEAASRKLEKDRNRKLIPALPFSLTFSSTWHSR